MNIIIKATNSELTPALHSFIEKKFSTLTPQVAKWDTGAVHLYVEVGRQTRHHHKGAVFYAEANLELPGGLIRVTHTDTTVRKSITAVKNTLKERLVKYREKEER